MFINGDLAIIVGGPWAEAIGRVVRVIRRCRTVGGRCVAADGLTYWMTADGPVYMVRPVSGSTLPVGIEGGEVLHRLKRRPVCGCHLRPILKMTESARAFEAEVIAVPKTNHHELASV